MTRPGYLAVVSITLSCASGPRPFPFRAPFIVDTDTRPVSIACRPDPTPKLPDQVRCTPDEYVSLFVWDHVDNLVFAPLSRVLSVDVIGEAENATSLDEVADSSWFHNRIGVAPLTAQQASLGECDLADILPTEVADGAWVIDHGKNNGSTLGFRVEVPGHGKYLLKADDADMPERASAASVIGAALYHAVGFSTSCEQVVLIRRAQLALKPGLITIDNEGVSRAFDDKALDAVLKSSTHVGQLTRMQASKWLPGLPIGPFRYVGVRHDDPNDIIDHQNRRELRGSRLLAAWMNHWDSREQNSMDLWLASDAKHAESSPGYVKHYILDTSDAFGGGAAPPALTLRLGHAYVMSLRDIALDFITLGILERPWDRARVEPKREKFGVFSARDFSPASWRGLYPNPAMLRMTERDGAWMARIIARFTPDTVRAIVGAGRFTDPKDAEYLVQVLIARQRLIFDRYLTRLSPLTDVRAIGTDQLCAVDLARSTGVLPAERFRYTVIERAGGKRVALDATPGPDGVVCFRPRSLAPPRVPDDSHERIAIFEVRNGTAAGPLEIHTYDLGTRGMFVVGLTRPAP